MAVVVVVVAVLLLLLLLGVPAQLVELVQVQGSGKTFPEFFDPDL